MNWLKTDELSLHNDGHIQILQDVWYDTYQVYLVSRNTDKYEKSSNQRVHDSFWWNFGEELPGDIVGEVQA